MRGLTLDGVGLISFQRDLPEPAIESPTDAIVAIRRAGLCGSDLHPYEGREEVRFGVIPGHEVVGVVAEVGDEVDGFAAADRVLVPFTTSCGRCAACGIGLSSRCERGRLFGYGDPAGGEAGVLQGGQAEHMRVPLAGSTLVAVPPSITDEEALLLSDNFPTGWFAAQQADLRAGEAVAVIGLGSVGLCAVVAAQRLGADPVVAVDPVDDRRRRAGSLGATTMTSDEAREAHGFGSVIEAAGTISAQRLAFDLLRPGGTLSLISVQTADCFPFGPVEAYDRNLTVRVGRSPVRSLLDRLLPMVARDELSVPADVLVTHTDVSLEEGPAIYRRFAAREEGMVKVAFTP